MLQPPPLTRLPRYPAVGGTILLAIVVSLRWWTGGKIDALFDNAWIGYGQPWRLLTSALPHGDILHLLFNVYWLWTLGSVLEGRLGSWRMLGVIALTAMVSGAAEYAVLDGGVGLSGVGYGVFGLLYVLDRRDPRFRGAMDSQTTKLFVGWFFLCIVLTVTNIMPIGNVAHAVGAVVGGLLGWTMTSARRAPAIATLALLSAASLAGATILRPYVNLSAEGGREEAYLGYRALVENRNEEAVHWCRLAAKYRSGSRDNLHNLAIALSRTGRDEEAQVVSEAAGDPPLSPGEPDGEESPDARGLAPEAR